MKRLWLYALCGIMIIACASKNTHEGEKYGFVSISEIIPDVLLDIRCHSTYNFVGTRVDGYDEPVALLAHQVPMLS